MKSAVETPAAPIECPRCGLPNPPGAPRCDCGYQYQAGPSALPISLLTTADRETVLKILLVLFVGGILGALWDPPFEDYYSLLLLFFGLMFLAVGGMTVLDSRSSAAEELKGLETLSVRTAVKQAEGRVSWRDILNRMLEASKEARSYCTVKTVADPHRGVKRYSYTILWQRMDFRTPNARHVTEIAWNGISFDWFEWVSLNGEIYRNAGFWFLSQDRSIDDTNRELSLPRVLSVYDLLRAGEPAEKGMYRDRYNQKRYLMLAYDPNALPSSAACKVRLWIHPKSGHLAKIETLSGDIKSEQIFACYNRNVAVRPPAWLNRSSDGMIRGSRIAIVPHYKTPASMLAPRFLRGGY